MKHGPLVSIIIPTHYRPEALLRALTAIDGQRYKAKEIVVIVDGRNTETLNILNRARQQGQPIRWIIRETPQGAMAARTTGFEHACGEFVIFHDDDDYFTDPNHLQRAASMCADNVVAVLSCGSVCSEKGEYPFTLGTTGHWSGSDFLRALPSAKVRNPPTTLFTLFRRSTLVESGILETGRINDTCTYLHALPHGDVVVLPDKIGIYNTTTTAQGRSLSFALPTNIFLPPSTSTQPLLHCSTPTTPFRPSNGLNGAFSAHTTITAPERATGKHSKQQSTGCLSTYSSISALTTGSSYASR